MVLVYWQSKGETAVSFAISKYCCVPVMGGALHTLTEVTVVYCLYNIKYFFPEKSEMKIKKKKKKLQRYGSIKEVPWNQARGAVRRAEVKQTGINRRTVLPPVSWVRILLCSPGYTHSVAQPSLHSRTLLPQLSRLLRSCNYRPMPVGPAKWIMID